MPLNPGVLRSTMAGILKSNPSAFQWEPIPTQHADMNLSVIPLENPVSSAQFPPPLRIVKLRR